MCQGSTGRMASSSSSCFRKEPALTPVDETVSPFFDADIRAPFFSVLKKCAFIALHVIAEEGRGGEDGCHAPGLVKSGLPKESNVEE